MKKILILLLFCVFACNQKADRIKLIKIKSKNITLYGGHLRQYSVTTYNDINYNVPSKDMYDKLMLDGLYTLHLKYNKIIKYE